MTYTLVGDGSIGLAALKFAEQLLDTLPGIDRVVVAGGEEVDWFLCEAYREWNLRAMLAEGGAALVIGREGRIALDEIHDGVSFSKKSAARPAIRKLVGELAAKNGAVDLAVGSANGTFIDAAESAAIAEFFPNALLEFPKHALGDALGAGALIQTIHGAMALQKRGLKKALVTSLGFNQQASGLVLKAN